MSPSLADKSLMRRPKKLIVCCDGTWMNSDSGWVKGGWFSNGHLQTPSNVTRITRAIKPEDSNESPQIVYYQAGIGTGIGLFSQIVGGGTGLGLSENIREAYAFLADNYSPGDSIFLIGFSRGAFTARSLGGLISQLGLLKKEHMGRFYEIFMDWENAGNPNWKGSLFLKNYRDKVMGETYKLKTSPSDPINYLKEYRGLLRALHLTQTVGDSDDVPIQAIGVWDTVGSLGVPVVPWLQTIFHLPSYLHEYKWTDTGLSNNVVNAFQALGLDEHRLPFSPAVWENEGHYKTNLKQVWFPGAHSNVGGSYDDTATADITLAWMMDQLSGDEYKASESYDPKNWIEFEDEYIKTQQDENLDWYKANQQPIRKWGLGAIFDSFTFPQCLAGYVTRRPGRYHKMNPKTGHFISNKLLENTNEYVHASVRARIAFRGRGLEESDKGPKIWTTVMGLVRKLLGHDLSVYNPPALRGWRLRDVHDYHDQGVNNGSKYSVEVSSREAARTPWWEWEGKDKHVARGKQLPEDRLGTYSLQLLDRFPQEAVEVTASNSGESSTAELERLRERQVARSETC